MLENNCNFDVESNELTTEFINESVIQELLKSIENISMDFIYMKTNTSLNTDCNYDVEFNFGDGYKHVCCSIDYDIYDEDDYELEEFMDLGPSENIYEFAFGTLKSRFDYNLNKKEFQAIYDYYNGKIEITGTLYDGRTAKIENIVAGEKLKLVLEPNNPYDKNAICVYSEMGDCGHLPSEISKNLIYFIKKRKWNIYAEVVEVMPLSKKSSRAKKADLFVKVKVD